MVGTTDYILSLDRSALSLCFPDIKFLLPDLCPFFGTIFTYSKRFIKVFGSLTSLLYSLSMRRPRNMVPRFKR